MGDTTIDGRLVVAVEVEILCDGGGFVGDVVVVVVIAVDAANKV